MASVPSNAASWPGGRLWRFLTRCYEPGVVRSQDGYVPLPERSMSHVAIALTILLTGGIWFLALGILAVLNRNHVAIDPSWSTRAVVLVTIPVVILVHEGSHWLGYRLAGCRDIMVGRAFACPTGLMSKRQQLAGALGPSLVLLPSLTALAYLAPNDLVFTMSTYDLLLQLLIGAADTVLIASVLRLPHGTLLQLTSASTSRLAFRAYVPPEPERRRAQAGTG